MWATICALISGGRWHRSRPELLLSRWKGEPAIGFYYFVSGTSAADARCHQKEDGDCSDCQDRQADLSNKQHRESPLVISSLSEIPRIQNACPRFGPLITGWVVENSAVWSALGPRNNTKQGIRRETVQAENCWRIRAIGRLADYA